MPMDQSFWDPLCILISYNQKQPNSEWYPPREEPCFRINHTPQPKGLDTAPQKFWESPTYAHMVRQSNQILHGDQTKW